jgi:hypothetical protein
MPNDLTKERERVREGEKTKKKGVASYEVNEFLTVVIVIYSFKANRRPIF